ncbi:uncharacterized protein [Branchiostoma lanceolatum]|uniref:uncharacterized protein n=1 Tax=Branchiostoma lanceolatum TaxID=7740 RepID=UPI0034563E23
MRLFCHRGYKLVGAKSIRCQADGTWSDRVPTCKEECYEEKATSFRGKLSVTRTGLTCQRWDSQTPHTHDRTAAKYPSSGLEQNYCRNPDGSSGAWCYTTDPRTRWDYCDVPICNVQCKGGYQLIAHSCFRAYHDKKSYNDAQAACEKDGATLAMPKTRQLDVALRNLIKDKKDNDYWIGLKQVPVRSWHWPDGSCIKDNSYKGWNPGEPVVPSFVDSNWWIRPQMCVQYWSEPTGTHMWDDVECDQKKKYICQASKGLIPRKNTKRFDISDVKHCWRA